MARTMGKNPKFYMGHPTTRFDVYPQAQKDEVVAYDGNYFWLKGQQKDGKTFWYTSPVGYEFTREITAEEAGYKAEPEPQPPCRMCGEPEAHHYNGDLYCYEYQP